jgi:uncharacterized C2H2 Zn-finger protein
MDWKYSCSRCDYGSNKKSSYEKHLQRKTPCDKTHEEGSSLQMLKCPTCTYILHTQSGLTRHLKVCNGNNPLECGKCKLLFKTKKAKQKHCKHVKCLPYDATRSMMSSASQPIMNQQCHINTTTNNIIIQQNNNINITINAFGKENIDYIKNDPRFPNIFARILNKQGAGLCQYVMYKHFHPEHKENHTVRKMVKKDRVIELFDGENWIPDMQDSALENLLSNIRSDYEHFIEYLFNSKDTNTLNATVLDKFMRNIGEAMELDVTGDYFDWSYDMTDEDKLKTRQKIYELLCTFIHTQSKKLFNDVLIES